MKRLSEGIYPSLSWAFIIMVLMGMPGNVFPAVVDFWEWLGTDKLVHLFLFSVLSFLFLWGYRNNLLTSQESYKRKMFFLSLSIGLLYAALTELLQYYLFINRYGSFFDFVADAIGCILGLFVFVIYLKKKIKKKQD